MYLGNKHRNGKKSYQYFALEDCINSTVLFYRMCKLKDDFNTY